MRLKLGHTLTVLVALSCTVQAAELLSTSTVIDEKGHRDLHPDL